MVTINTIKTKTNMRYIQRYFSAILLMLLSVNVCAEDLVNRDIIEISAGIGYYDFDDKRNLDDSGMAAVGLGMHFSRRWAFSLNYSALQSTTNVSGTTPTVDMQKYHVDVYRYFNTENRLRPYLVAGYGQMDIVYTGVDSNETLFNGGIGLSYQLTPSWSVRSDVRVFSHYDSDYTDNALTLVLVYRLNGGEK